MEQRVSGLNRGLEGWTGWGCGSDGYMWVGVEVGVGGGGGGWRWGWG